VYCSVLSCVCQFLIKNFMMMMMMMKFILAVSGFVLSVLSHVISCEERKPVCVET